MSLSEFEKIERAGFTQRVTSMMVASVWGLCVNDPVEYRSETWITNAIKQQQAEERMNTEILNSGRK